MLPGGWVHFHISNLHCPCWVTMFPGDSLQEGETWPSPGKWTPSQGRGSHLVLSLLQPFLRRLPQGVKSPGSPGKQVEVKAVPCWLQAAAMGPAPVWQRRLRVTTVIGRLNSCSGAGLLCLSPGRPTGGLSKPASLLSPPSAPTAFSHFLQTPSQGMMVNVKSGSKS